MIDQILGFGPEKRFNDVVLLDPADTDWLVGFNILCAHSEVEKNIVASELGAVFGWLLTKWGDQTTFWSACSSPSPILRGTDANGGLLRCDSFELVISEGIVIVKVEPLPVSLSTVTFPPSSSVNSLTMYNPSPTPSKSRASELSTW